MNDIANKTIVLKLNRNWKAVQVCPVGKTLCDMMTGAVQGMNISYAEDSDGNPDFDVQEYANPVDWDTWITLPVRPWDLCIHSSKMVIRVPTVVITSRYSKIHVKKQKGKPTKEGLFMRDNGIDGYTGEEIDYEEATIDHVIPRSRGGADTYENTVLTTKEINNKKGNKLNHEAGLKLVVNPHSPKPIVAMYAIKKIRHRDWKPFLPQTNARKLFHHAHVE